MDKEERKQYNKVYYSVNKDRILADLCQKVQCEYCGRTVIKNNILTHEKSEICKRHRERRLELLKFKQLNDSSRASTIVDENGFKINIYKYLYIVICLTYRFKNHSLLI